MRVQNDQGDFLYYNRNGLFDGHDLLRFPAYMEGTIAKIEDIKSMMFPISNPKESHHNHYYFYVGDWHVLAILYDYNLLSPSLSGVDYVSHKKVKFYIENENSLGTTANAIIAGLLGTIAWKYTFAILNFVDFINVYNNIITNIETDDWLLTDSCRKEFNDFQIPASNSIANNYIKSPYISEVGFGLEITVPSKTKIEDLALSNIKAEFTCYI